MEYKVFVYEGDTSKDDLSRRLAVDAVKAYCSAAGIAFDEARNLMREGENGKPYMEGLTSRISARDTASKGSSGSGPTERPSASSQGGASTIRCPTLWEMTVC